DGYHSDKIHLKNELKQIGSELNLDVEIKNQLLKPAHDLLDDYDFWKYNSDMLALFIIDGHMEIYQLSVKLDNSTHFIGKRPFLLPLIPELSKDGNYYLLLLDLIKIRLYEGSRNHIRELKLDPEAVALSFAAEEER